MWFRRALYFAQFPAALVLPTWVLISRGLLADGIGWTFLVYLVACPILCISMLAVAGLVLARKSVRTERAVSWLDAGLFTGWYASLILYGFYAFAIFAVAVLIFGLAAFWLGLWQLFTDTRTRVQGAMADFDRQAAAPTKPSERYIGEVIVIQPNEQPDK
jgi:hypothetical protein